MGFCITKMGMWTGLASVGLLAVVGSCSQGRIKRSRGPGQFRVM